MYKRQLCGFSALARQPAGRTAPQSPGNHHWPSVRCILQTMRSAGKRRTYTSCRFHPCLLYTSSESCSSNFCGRWKWNRSSSRFSLYAWTNCSSSSRRFCSQNNICSNISAIAKHVKLYKTDTLLSFLPIHHTFECTITFLYGTYSCLLYTSRHLLGHQFHHWKQQEVLY